jgi:hypothetical protein
MNHNDKRTAEALRAKPGIQVSRLEIGTTITLETLDCIYTLKKHPYGNSLVEVQGTDARFLKPCVGQFMHSQYGKSPAEFTDWIGKSMRPCIRFKGGPIILQPVVSARVEGDGWHYDVF